MEILFNECGGTKDFPAVTRNWGLLIIWFWGCVDEPDNGLTWHAFTDMHMHAQRIIAPAPKRLWTVYMNKSADKPQYIMCAACHVRAVVPNLFLMPPPRTHMVIWDPPPNPPYYIYIHTHTHAIIIWFFFCLLEMHIWHWVDSSSLS